MGLKVTNSSFKYEKPDGRYALFLDDVIGATITSIKMMKAKDNDSVIKLKKSSGVTLENAVYYPTEWDTTPVELSGIDHTVGKDIIKK